MPARIACALLFLASLSAQQPPPPAMPSSSQHASPETISPAQGYRISGTVVNSMTGQALPGAAVAIAPVNGPNRDISKALVTGADGKFSFSGLSRGKYSLMAEARGFSWQHFEHHDPYATAIAVGPDLDSTHLTFRLQPDASVEGMVTDENNEPIQYAMVRLFEVSAEGGQQKTLPMNQVQTDDQGRYHIGHLQTGTYYLVVSARPWYAQNVRPSRTNASDNDVRAAQEDAALDVTYPLTFYPGTTDSGDATPLQLTPGEKVTADVALHAVPSLHLRIHTGGTADNAVLDRMVFPRVWQRIFEGFLDSVFNAPDSWVAPGVMEISGLAPGHYIVEMPASASLDEKKSERGWYREIDLAGDTDVSAADNPHFASVRGIILFEGANRPPNQAAIRLYCHETGESFRGDFSERGEFDFNAEDVRPGRYDVLLDNADGFFLNRLSATGARVVGQTLDIGGSTPGVRISAIASRGAAEVTGTALREDEPFAGAMIVLTPHDPVNNSPLFRRDQSDSDGTFTLPNVVPGQYTVVAIANGWDLEWANPAVLEPYLKKGEKVDVPVSGKLQIKVNVQ